MKMEARAPVKPKRMNGTKRGFILLSVSLVGLAAYFLVLDLYIVRELLLFVACAALLVFFAAILALLGILFHAAGRILLHSVRKVRPRFERVGSNRRLLDSSSRTVVPDGAS